MDNAPNRDYPLGERRPELVRTPAGTPLEELTLAAARDGSIARDELRATPETLRRQADVARAAGRVQLADNLERAAELTALPDGQLLEIYTALRPGRSTPADLERWARRLEAAGAARTAAFVREAAAVAGGAA
ncbi:MAG TPA: diol dehydratase small subunit [Gaiellaceae bacterium]|nr:diol dehydratase small subunit [Gaiellaceae bacterium]